MISVLQSGKSPAATYRNAATISPHRHARQMRILATIWQQTKKPALGRLIVVDNLLI